MFLTVWADDTWLQEHAGATLEGKEGEDDNDQGQKRPSEESEAQVSLMTLLNFEGIVSLYLENQECSVAVSLQ